MGVNAGWRVWVLVCCFRHLLVVRRLCGMGVDVGRQRGVVDGSVEVWVVGGVEALFELLRCWVQVCVCAWDDDDSVFASVVVLNDDGGCPRGRVLDFLEETCADVVGLQVGDEVVCDGVVVAQAAEEAHREAVRGRLELGDGNGAVEALTAEVALEGDALDGFAWAGELDRVRDEVLVEGTENRDWHCREVAANLAGRL